MTLPGLEQAIYGALLDAHAEAEQTDSALLGELVGLLKVAHLAVKEATKIDTSFRQAA